MNVIDSAIVELMEFCLGTDIKQSFVPSCKEISPSYVKYTAVFKYKEWIVRVNTNCSHTDKLDEIDDFTTTLSNFVLTISTVEKYGKIGAQNKLSKEYSINGESHVGYVQNLTNAFKDFTDFVRRTVYELKKNGKWDDPTSIEENGVDTIDVSGESDKLNMVMSILKENNSLLKEIKTLLMMGV